MSAHYWNHHLSVPHFHSHAPHLEWHRVERPLRALLLAAIGVLGIAAAGLAAREVPGVVAKAAPAAEAAFHRVDLTRHYQHTNRSVDFQHMYGRDAGMRGIEDMYAKPRSRSGGR